jgi:hypothetical protein
VGAVKAATIETTKMHSEKVFVVLNDIMHALMPFARTFFHPG